jgi:hypothetical protein
MLLASQIQPQILSAKELPCDLTGQVQSHPCIHACSFSKPIHSNEFKISKLHHLDNFCNQSKLLQVWKSSST